MALDEWEAVTRTAMKRLVTHANKVGLANTGEFTFRAFFMEAAWDLLDRPEFETEWNKFDLLVRVGDVATLIEFKYYLWRRTYDLEGGPGRRKGGAGAKNEKEFEDSLAKLRSAPVVGITHRRLVLVYADDSHLPGRSFHASYAALGESEQIAEVWRVSADAADGCRLEGRIFRPTPPTSPSPDES